VAAQLIAAGRVAALLVVGLLLVVGPRDVAPEEELVRCGVPVVVLRLPRGHRVLLGIVVVPGAVVAVGARTGAVALPVVVRLVAVGDVAPAVAVVVGVACAAGVAEVAPAAVAPCGVVAVVVVQGRRVVTVASCAGVRIVWVVRPAAANPAEPGARRIPVAVVAGRSVVRLARAVVVGADPAGRVVRRRRVAVRVVVGSVLNCAGCGQPCRPH